MLDNRLQKKGLPHPLLQKPFVVSVSNFFIVSVETTDTICPIRKTSSLWYRLLPTDSKNLFLEIKKNPQPRSEPTRPRSRRWARKRPPFAMQRGGRQWSPLSGRSHHCRGRWPPSSREEAVVDIPWGRPCAPHRREREPAACPAVLNLGEDAHEASRRGRCSRTLGSEWLVTPLPVRARRRRAALCRAPRRLSRRCASLALSLVQA
jgi:hypothetical protein